MPRTPKAHAPSIHARALLLMSCALATGGAHAHGTEQHADETVPGLTLSLGPGVNYIDAANPYPTPRIEGVLGAGSPESDLRGEHLEYIEFGARARFTSQLDGNLRVTYHGMDGGSTDLESLWLSARAPDWGSAARLGRQELPLGFENLIHDHARSFGIAPMAMRADVHDGWSADGLRVDIELPANFSLGGGLWNNTAYPGADAGGINLATANLSWHGKPWQAQIAYANADADGRALLTTGQGGHTHSAPSCSGAPTLNRVCFDGRVHLLVLAARWQPETTPWWFGGEYWYRKESGVIDSIYGTPDYTGKTGGGWIDLGYRFNSKFSLAARLEQLQMSNYLNGANAALIAQQAGIANADQTPIGAGLVAEWYPLPELRLVAEWHYSTLNEQSDNSVMLRAQVLFEKNMF